MAIKMHPLKKVRKRKKMNQKASFQNVYNLMKLHNISFYCEDLEEEEPCEPMIDSYFKTSSRKSLSPYKPAYLKKTVLRTHKLPLLKKNHKFLVN